MSEYLLVDETATRALGAALAAALSEFLPQDLSRAVVIYLEGDLGVGKTTLVRGLLQALAPEEVVKSPTYTLVELHVVSRLYLYHFDFYRFKFPEEFLDAGLEEHFSESALCLVEWPGQAAPYLPPADLRISLGHAGEQRRVEIHVGDRKEWPWLKSIATRVQQRCDTHAGIFLVSPPPV